MPLLFLFFLTSLAIPSLSIRPDLVIEISRHGARAPNNNTYDLQNYWKGYLGELTGVGMRMSYLLGAAYREDYPDLLASYDATAVYARSTDKNHSIVGAYSKLFGVYNGTGPGLGEDYPPELAVPPYDEALIEEVLQDMDNSYAIPYNFQPVPVHIVEMRYDTVLLGSSKACPKSQDWIAANAVDSEVLEVYNKYLQDVVGYLNGLNISINSFSDLYVFADLAIANKYENITIPGDISPNSSYYRDLRFAYEWYTAKLYQGLNIQKQLNALVLLDYVMEILNHTANEVGNLKFGFFSGHDTTILSVLSAFDITNKSCLLENYVAETEGKQPLYPLCVFPAFSSNLKFELYDTDKPWVRFYYNDIPVEICGGGVDCGIQALGKYVAKVTDSYTVKDYNDVCGIKSQQKITIVQRSSKSTLWVLLVLTGVLSVGLVLACNQRKKGQQAGNDRSHYMAQS